MNGKYVVFSSGLLLFGSLSLDGVSAQAQMARPAQTQVASVAVVQPSLGFVEPLQQTALVGTDIGSMNISESVSESASQPAVAISEARHHTFFSSLALSSGYDTAADDLPGASSALGVVESYSGILMHGRDYSMMIRHDAKILRYLETGAGTQQYQLTTALLSGAKSPQTNWSMLLENGFGSNAARAVGSISAPLTNSTELPDPNSATFGFDNGNVLSDHAVLTVEHRVSATRTASLSAQGYYHHFFDTGLSDQRYGISGSLREKVSRRQSFGVEAEAAQEIYSGSRCTIGYVGVSSLTQLTRGLRFEGTIGPTLGSGLCSGLFQYNVLLTMATARTNRLYAGANRQRSDGLVSSSTWQDSAFAGVAMGHPRKLMTLFDAGYSRYTLSNPTPANPDLHGFFVSGELRHRISHLTDVSLTARYFSTGAGASQVNRSLILLTYTWSSEQRPAAIRTFGAAHEHR